MRFKEKKKKKLIQILIFHNSDYLGMSNFEQITQSA